MKANRESGYVSIFAVLALMGGLIVAGVVGITGGDPGQREEEQSPAVPPVSSVSQPSLFLLGDGIDPTVPGLASIAGSGVGADWQDLFNADGTLRDDYDENGVLVPGGNGTPDAIDRFGGRAAYFIADDVSADANIDRTILGDSADRWTSGRVSASQDLGNAYVFVTSDASGNAVLYLGLERLTARGASRIEAEFSERPARLDETSGEIVRERSDGDLLIRISYDRDGALAAVEILSWTSSEEGISEYVAVAKLEGEGCIAGETLCAFSNADTIDGGAWPSFDASGAPVSKLAPRTFTELGVNLGDLPGSEANHSYALIQSLEDLGEGPGPVVAGGVSGAPCIFQDPGTGAINCSANDVRIGTLEVVGDPVTCDPTSPDLVEVTLKATILSGPERYDIGLWINQSGGSAQNDADGTCYRDILTPPGTFPTDTTGNCDSVSGPYANGDDDSCGDIPKTDTECTNTVVVGNDLITEYTFTALIACADSDDNGTVDASACTSWSQNPDEIICGGVLDAIPGSPAKCECDTFDIGGLFTGCRTAEDCDDGATCTEDVCTIVDNVGTCTNPPITDFCDDGNVCTLDSCDPELGDSVTGCVHVPVTDDSQPQCEEGVCVPALCPGGTDDDDDPCIVGECNEDGTCAAPDPVAESTLCEDGLYCTSETGAPGTPDHCDGAGTCFGIPVNCGPGDQCNDDVCDEDANACIVVPKAESTTCEDGLYCTSETGAPGTPDHCDGAGTCFGIPVNCGPGDQCNDDVCDEDANACIVVPKAESTTCEDGLYCTSETGAPGTPDHCDGAGTCFGIPVNCGPGDQCNDDVCDEDANACIVVPKAESTTCEDGLYCTSETGAPGTPDHCDGAGTCFGIPVNCGPGDQCNDDVCDEDANACIVVPKAESTTCEDGLYCTSETGAPGTPDHCDGAGTCFGIPVNCGPGDQCNDDVCDEDANACIVVPKAESTTCEDGLYCTSETGAPGTPDHCDGAGTCFGIPVNCGPGDQCNDDVCDEDANACIVVPKAESTTCEDGLYCTSETGAPGTPDHCDGAGTCFGIPVNCGPGDQCNDDVCDEDANACIVVPKAESTTCEDGLYCTSETGAPGTPDHCDGAGTCFGIPVNCGPGDQCNDDVCDEDANACIVVPKAESTTCEDGLYCTSETGAPGTPDHCDGAGTCFGIPVNCGPGDQCNDDVCDEDANACIVVPKAESTTCEDGLYCTSETGAPGTPDHCDGAGTCFGIPVNCGPGDNCNDNVCNEDADECGFVPKANSTPCQDGDVCTSETGEAQTPDHCFNGVCTGIPVDCSDFDNQCNVGTCDPVTGACFADPVPDGTICDDGNPDTSDDVCIDGECLGCDPQPRTQGYWHRQCLGLSFVDGGIDPGRDGHGIGPTEPNFPGGVEAFLELRDSCSEVVLSDNSFGTEMWPDASPWGSLTCNALDGTPPSDQCEKASKQLAALILNQCSGKLSPFCELVTEALPGECGGPEVTTVGELIDWAIGNLNGTYCEDVNGEPIPDCTLASCNEVAQCAAAVNEGPGVGAPDEAEYDDPMIFNETITKESGTTGDQQIGDRSESLSLGRSAGGRR